MAGPTMGTSRTPVAPIWAGGVILVRMGKEATPGTSNAEARSEGRSRSTLWAPWIAVMVALLTLGGNVYLNISDHREARHSRLLEHRREALLAALAVIDHVYSREPRRKKVEPPRVGPFSWLATP